MIVRDNEPLKIGEWLESPQLARSVTTVALLKGLTDPADIDDVIQEVRIALWEKGLGEATSVWVRQVARNKAVDLIRRRIRERRMTEEQKSAPRFRFDPELPRLLQARAAALPNLLKQFYELHYQHAFSERELADRLGIGRSAVRLLDQSCRHRLQH